MRGHRYRTLFGYEYFDDLSAHPNRVVREDGYASSAAGAYQIIRATWRWLVSRYGFADFQPETQDAAAVALLIHRDALEGVRAGRLEEATRKAAREWASLPFSPYGQPMRTMDFVRRVFKLPGGREEGVPAPIEQRTFPPAPAPAPVDPRPSDAFAGLDKPPTPIATLPPASKPMSPFVIPALDALARLVPTIADLFKGEAPSKVAERNVDVVKAIADKVIPIVVQATGAPNVQAAVEAAQADPKVASDIDAAARREYFELQRVSVREAREFAVAYAQAKDVRTVVGRFTFLEFLTLVIVAVSATLTGWLIHERLLVGELLGAVVTLVLVAGFVDVRRFWLGLPAADPPKDK